MKVVEGLMQPELVSCRQRREEKDEICLAKLILSTHSVTQLIVSVFLMGECLCPHSKSLLCTLRGRILAV